MMPPGRTIGNSTGKLGGAWGQVRGLNGVIIAANSYHKDGGEYRWHITGVVLELPDGIADMFADASPASDAASDAVIKAFIKAHTTASRPTIIAGWKSALCKHFNDARSRHMSTVSVTTGAMKKLRAGYLSARTVLDTLRPMFLDAVAKPPASDKQNESRTGNVALSEWRGIVAWAVGQANDADLDDVHRRVNENMPENNSGTVEYDQPVSLTDPVPVPPFPVDALPDVIVQKVSELAEATQTDPAMAATSALTVLAACAGGHAKIRIRPGWIEPLCLFTNTIARPAERKSAVQQSMVKPLLDAEEVLSASGEMEHLKLADELDMAKKMVDQLNKAAVNAAAKAAAPKATDKDRADAKTAADAAKAAKAAMRQIEVPVIPRLLADDVTPEATATLLADHGGRIAIISAEGGIFDTIAGRYAKTVNVDVYLKGHAGDRIKVDRQGRAAQHIPSPALTMGLMVQPRIIEAIAANRDFRGRGLLARFLYAVPVSKVGFRKSAATPVSESTEAKYSHWIKKLASEMAEWAGDPMILTLTEHAAARVGELQDDVESMLAEDGDLSSPPSLQEWGGKLVGAVIRIAGLLHLGEHGQKTARTYPVQVATIEAAERIGWYFKAAAINVFAEMDTDPATADAAYLLGRIGKIRGHGDEISERDMHMATKSRFRKKDALMVAVDLLVQHGYLIRQQANQATGGRPGSPRYVIRLA
jgi:hypothetical protein